MTGPPRPPRLPGQSPDRTPRAPPPSPISPMPTRSAESRSSSSSTPAPTRLPLVTSFAARVARSPATYRSSTASAPSSTPSDAQRLSTNPAFHAVSLNAKVESEGNDFDDRLVTSYNESIEADEAWDDNYTGKGVGVAVIDTGIQGDLPDFRESRTNPASRVVASAVVNPGASNRRGHPRSRHPYRRSDRGRWNRASVQRSAPRPLRRRRAGRESDLRSRRLTTRATPRSST